MAKNSNADFYVLGTIGVLALGAIIVGFVSGRKKKSVEGIGSVNRKIIKSK